jgi:hypothetical protein
MRNSLLAIAVVFTAAVAGASEGQLEINQSCVATGCFPGDAPGFPVTITAAGAYRLTSNLSQTVIAGISSATDAILIDSDDVDLDLGGFRISCSQPLASGSICSGSGSGVRVSPGNFRSGARIANGSIRGMPSNGIDLSNSEGNAVHAMRLFENGMDGVLGAGGVRIESSIAIDNGGRGFSASAGSVVKDCVARRNGTGISATNAMVLDNLVSSNNGNGMTLSGRSHIRGNEISHNDDHGVEWSGGGPTVRLIQNTFTGNGSSDLGPSPAFFQDGGGNLCGTSGSCF